MTNIYIWIISFLAIAGVIIRPFKVAEVIWAVSGALVLLLFGFINLNDGFAGIAKGTDVYLFLTGMMLLAETARNEKLFDWLAAHATQMAKGSPKRLFFLIYLVGVIVTTFLSNDATAVVLTPAVAAAVKAAKVKNPLPYLFICAFIANAASFVLPISNPANLVIYGNHMPALLVWMSHYLVPSVVSIVVTYLVLFATQRDQLKEDIETNIRLPQLSQGGKTALIGIGATAIILLVSSALDIQLGLPTAITGVLTSAIVLLMARKSPWEVIKGVSWAVLPLVAGLFVIVEALNKTGLTEHLAGLLQQSAAENVNYATWYAGLSTAFACNLMNNLPAGLIAGNVIQIGHVPEMVKSAVLIGIDLGPNLSLTGSLATILWLVALRREGQEVSAWAFLKLGAVVMTVTLLAVLGSLFI
ncbi:arsenic transporter [Mucilaginibacter sp. PAMC 26640]|nr:arsenic transporter [Mucilaginibacter sp. PAMC 26640]